MRVLSVEKEYDRYSVHFEHDGTSWWKFLPRYPTDDTLREWLNSVIADTILRIENGRS